MRTTPELDIIPLQTTTPRQREDVELDGFNANWPLRDGKFFLHTSNLLEGFWRRTRNFKPLSSDEDELAPLTTPTEGRLSSPQIPSASLPYTVGLQQY
ncbi:hypothetical protein TNCV_852511 [Trichonephila clavipes]|nr:hypothetical protein TNCV_852511 [Trichonephila clavipes]